VAVDADHHAAELLDTLLVTLLDAVGDGDGVAGTELVDFFLGGCESLFRNFHQIHDAFSFYFVITRTTAPFASLSHGGALSCQRVRNPLQS